MKIIFEMMRKNRREVVSISLAIMLAAILISSLCSLYLSVNMSKSKYYAELNGNYQYRLLLNQKNKKHFINYIEEHPDLISSYAFTEKINEGNDPFVYTVLKCDSKYFDMDNIKLLKGNFPSEKNEVVAEEWVLQNLKLSVGDEFTDGDYTYRITGVVSDSPQKLDENIVLYTFDAEPSDHTYVYLNFKNLHNIKKGLDVLKDELNLSPKSIGVNWDVVEPLGVRAPEESSSILQSLINRINLSEKSIAILLSLFCGIIIFGILNIVYQKRDADYRTIILLGIDILKFSFAFCEEVLVIYIIAYPLGVIVGLGLTSLFYNYMMSYLLPTNMESISCAISCEGIYIGAIVLMLVLCLVACIEANNVYKKNDFIHKKITKLKYDNRSISYSKKRLFVGLVKRYIFRNLKAFAIVIVSLGMGGALFISANYYSDQLYNEIELTQASDDGLDSDIKIEIQTDKFNEGVTKKQIINIGKIKGVNKVLAASNYYGGIIISKDKMKYENFFDSNEADFRIDKYFGGICTPEENNQVLIKGNIYGYTSNLLKDLKPYMINGSLDYNQISKSNGIVVCLPQDGGSHKFDELDINVGDYISVKTPKDISLSDETAKLIGNDSQYEIKKYKVIATVKRATLESPYFIGNSGVDLIMTDRQLKDNYGIEKYNMISVMKNKDARDSYVFNQVNTELKNIDRCLVTDYSSVLEKATHNVTQRRIMYNVICCILILICVFNMINTIGYVNRVRKNDKVIFSMLGMNTKDLLKISLIEGTIVGGCTAVMVVVFGKIIVSFMYRCLCRTFYLFSPKATYDKPIMFLVCIVCVMIGILTEVLAENAEM